MPCAVIATMLVAAAIPAPANAQIGGLLKKKVKEKIVQKAGGADSTAIAAGDTSAAGAAGKRARAATPSSGPRFNEYVLEITPTVLDQLEKGIAAEEVVRQKIERKIGKVLTRDEYEKCEAAVLSGPEGQKVYEQARNLATGDTTYERIQKASEELARRMEQVVEPKCGLEPRKAEEIRTQHADSMEAAAPAASGLTRLQLTIVKERILPLCAATQAVAAAASEVRVPAGAQHSANPIYYVYTPNEVNALQPRCAKLASALRTAL
jgi:hypothetical protein